MRAQIVVGLLACLLQITTAEKTQLDPDLHRQLLLSGRPQVGLWQALMKQKQLESAVATSDSTQHPFVTQDPTSIYEAHCFEQPLSHFDDSVNGTFCQRYWFDASAYKPGGPVFVLDGGETSGADRLPFLEKGIIQILANATEGLAIVLEHRYYGESIPVPDLSTDNLRFLNNAESLEDSAYFIENFKPPASLVDLVDESALHPNNTPWIYYGGSYAGARAAHMRTQYPDIVWGAIASSAVTHSQIIMPEYFDPIMQYGPEDCISTLQSTIQIIDKLLETPEPLPSLLKSFFGLPGLSNGDFGEVLQSPLGLWQAKNWDPAVGSEAFYGFCDALTAGGAASQIGLVRIPAAVVNFAGYIKTEVVTTCPPGQDEKSIQDCFGSDNDAKFQVTDLSQTWRLWLFQVCTQWGYFQIAPTDGPSIVSKFLDLEQGSKICRQAYPPGKYFTVPEWPDVEEINRRGDYGIAMDRLAFIDGDRDPWRPMTPGADIAPKRTSTVKRPVHIIFDGVHHYDENGLTDHSAEPARIRDVHELEVNFVSEWLEEWKEYKFSQSS
ncbi:serine carboxypeptidase S28-domain-containing protein [Naematelia encephala]|uniref:Serine carboxypeptidase S28-domain-containing protein n=1 Tax=Naematelia encephala TaxID=71784 RepID=A0A1Y2BG60_9TREE|nr:serine carboxypeptidase S28-domain-containing protein [Naematelia encephala]